MEAIRDRFMSKIKVTKKCWIWTGSKNDEGYGNFGFLGKTEKAHRLAYEFFNGHITKGKMVCHLCDNPSCVNPNHLFLGTNKENMMDMVRKGRKIEKAARGEANGNAKLNEKIVKEIKESKEPNGFFVKKYGIPKSTVSYVRNHGWKHIGETHGRASS